MRQRVLYGVLTVTLLVMPIGLGALMLFVLMNGATFNQFQSLTSDEFYYWQQGLSASVAPFHSGYYSNNEVLPALDTIGRFQYWGPFVPHYYALVSRLLGGWHNDSMIWVNLISFTAALGLFVAIVRPKLESLAWLNVVVLTFVPLWIYIPTGLTEVLHQATAIGIAAGFALMLQGENPPSARARWGLLIFLSVITLMFRVTWGILFVPLVILWQRDNWKRWPLVTSLAVALVGIIGMYILRGMLWTVFPEQHFERFKATLAVSVPDALSMAYTHFLYNLNGMHWEPLTNQLLYVALRVLVTLMIVAAVWVWLRWRWMRGQHATWTHILMTVALGALMFVLWDPIRHGVWPLAAYAFGGTFAVYMGLLLLRRRIRHALSVWEIGFHLFNILAIVGTISIFYDVFDWRGYRTIAPHLLLSLMVLAVMRRRAILLAVIAVALWSVPNALTTVYPDYYFAGGKFPADSAPNPFVDELAALMPFDPHADDPWCNSVAIGANADFMRFTAIPAGIGFNRIYPSADILPDDYWFQSRYLWIPADDFARYAENGEAEYIGDVGGTPFYLNLERTCN